MQIAYNKTKRSQKPKYIVVHDTGNSGKGANAKAHFNYFNGGDRGASADFFVDDKEALQVNDYNTYYTWHCGDGKGKNGITNSNSVGIEICINSDGDYNKAVMRAQALVAKLMKELNIPLSNVVRHYDASGKICPNSMSKNNWQAWNTFKAGLELDDAEFVQKAAGLEDKTMSYLKSYTYGKDLLAKLAKAMGK